MSQDTNRPSQGSAGPHQGRRQARSTLQTSEPYPYPKKRHKVPKNKGFDPFQIFQVSQRSCLLLHVRVLHGRHISGGWVADLIHTPCPCVTMHMANAAEPEWTTRHIDSQVNPQWNEGFTFHLDPRKHNVLDVTLVDRHAWYGGELGTISIHCSELVMDKAETRTLHFNGTCEVDVELRAEFDPNPTLRYSLCLSDEEKRYRKSRRARVFDSLKRLLGDKAPDHISRTPTVAVIGSGGGFRAMVGFAGAFKALTETGLLDCATYVGALSGSSWYLSQLYSHPRWPSGDVAYINAELRQQIDHTFLWLLKPSGLFAYLDRIRAKRSAGLPVSFTDLFGYLVGDTLLKGRMTSRLSDQRAVVERGLAPLPLYTCVHVKKDISARVFQEWVEFSPFEVGLPKYGIFMKSHLFGSKFFMGKIIQQFAEPPLHYLQGIWGSAFCILFRRLLQKNRKETNPARRDPNRRAPKRRMPSSASNGGSAPKCRRVDQTDPEQVILGKKQADTSYFGNLLEKLFSSSRFSLLSTRTARAGVVHNPLRGLSLQQTYPFTPFSAKPTAEPVSAMDEFHGLYDLHPTSEKYLYLVDAGLTFNSPYPVVLRPQRTVDVIISYDFSARDSDRSPPFKELLLAEKWAKLNGAPFPPVDVSVWDPEDPQEVYVFQHPTDPTCPVILHFVLVNATFRHYKEPGIERETEEEKRFGDFSLFDDPASPYSTFTFTYSHESFDRLSQLVEYNTQRNQHLISDVIAQCARRKQKQATQLPVTSGLTPSEAGFRLLPMKTAKNKFKLKRSLKE